MLTLTGNGRLTRDVELRSTRSGDSVATVSVASDRRDREADAIYVDLIVCRRQAEAAAEHLVKGQAVGFSGRFEPRQYTTRDGREGVG
jgi:single-strand DNA-binding protein